MAALRRATDILYAGELEIRLGEGLVLAGGRALTPVGARVRAARGDGAQSRGDRHARGAVRAVWGGELRHGDRSVDVYVSKLRGKLEEAMPDRRFIHTHPGFGYRFQPAALSRPGQPARLSRAADDTGRGGSRFHEMFTSARQRLRDCAQHRRHGVPRDRAARQHAIQPEET